MTKNFYFIIRVFVILIVSTLSLFAQGGDAPIFPIDGGASFLAAAGLGYGIKKVRDYKRKNKTPEEE